MLKKFVSDTFQGGVFTLTLSASTQPLEELSKFEKISCENNIILRFETSKQK